MIILNHTQILKIIIYFLVYKAKSKMVNIDRFGDNNSSLW